eukprot:CAMPEP_0172387056 /NCGR_PEP_ID=MMETSP1061-20121228/4463_1 /TAXON_ID=37318 /ORGANISM="Pseudo-nitzschia pungens, Strain cf. pungens" /LENGTH=64 /DNA_ID=CAMNT_0013116613 /DNA_START=807 /DNA_END=1001 /DNA_ORIENTATION=-
MAAVAVPVAAAAIFLCSVGMVGVMEPGSEDEEGGSGGSREVEMIRMGASIVVGFVMLVAIIVVG